MMKTTEKNEAAVPQATATPQTAAPQRRVGTVTMGFSMIAAGVILLCWLFEWIDNRTLLWLCRLAPLMLVGIGAELCIWGAAGEKVRLKYDFLSLIFCGLLLCLCLGMCTLAILARQGLLEYWL